MFAYAAATLLLWMIAARVDHLNSGSEELEIAELAKPPVGGNVVVEKVGWSLDSYDVYRARPFLW